MIATPVPLRFVTHIGFWLLLGFSAGCGPQASDGTWSHGEMANLDPQRLLSLKNAIRTKLMQRSFSVPSQGTSPEADYRPSEDPAALVDMGEALERKLHNLDAAGLTHGAIEGEPWSDYYWPTAVGLLGNRYADPSFADGGDWPNLFDYVRRHSVASVLASRDQTRINALSPAEKYDLLIRDEQKPLTTAMWNEGQALYERDGHIPGWVGLCDGWAAASIMVPRPRKAVAFRAATGQEITLYPSDIKALVSLLWAKGNAPVRHMGGRCNDVYPDRDENGRRVSRQCLDSNPGAWHLAVVNQIGVAKRGLIMDAAYDYQVWNQPILSYSYTYFNPRTGHAVATLQDATVAVTSFPEDRFKAYRSSVAHHIVGITMEVVYLNETRPMPYLTDGPEADAKVRIQYRYDVELDADGNVIGGEWHQDRHPDFLWVPVPGATVTSMGESYLQGEWNLSDQTPAPWTIPLRVSAQNGQPAARIVNTLLEQTSAP